MRSSSEWHPSIGKAILENWEFSEDMAQAVGSRRSMTASSPSSPDLSDVLAVAILMASYGTDICRRCEAMLQGLPAANTAWR